MFAKFHAFLANGKEYRIVDFDYPLPEDMMAAVIAAAMSANRVSVGRVASDDGEISGDVFWKSARTAKYGFPVDSQAYNRLVSILDKGETPESALGAKLYVPASVAGQKADPSVELAGLRKRTIDALRAEGLSYGAILRATSAAEIYEIARKIRADAKPEVTSAKPTRK